MRENQILCQRQNDEEHRRIELVKRMEAAWGLERKAATLDEVIEMLNKGGE